ncbi:hypothetical protein DUI87_14832 [Hirundo rustica rustica]|uniref:Exonuclease domain-containing protein n=1 Tax=Hirundo rustica rustica TaxID=333673 RepID=A0A3M0K606_HIRRU|nr:hypothetical protein DUI87_14832 [Hirundo rustica rustica]
MLEPPLGSTKGILSEEDREQIPVETRWFSSIVSRKLASHGFGASMAAMSSFPPQRYHYFLVLDFEATCDKPQIHPQEIIEFPILKLNGRTMEIESTFHMYVQPVVHPQLTPFCTELTGIIQGMVDGQPSLQQVLERVDEWMAKEGLLDPSVKSIFVTCGDWDLKVIFLSNDSCLHSCSPLIYVLSGLEFLSSIVLSLAGKLCIFVPGFSSSDLGI